MKKGCLSSSTLALLGFLDRGVAENNGRADDRTPLRSFLSFEKWYLVVSPILTHPGGFHLLGILSLAKMYSSLQGTCIVCERAHLSSVKSREAAEPAFGGLSLPKMLALTPELG